jgi:hypothetical protein
MQRGTWVEDDCEYCNRSVEFEDCICTAVAESELAILVTLTDGEQIWLPCSTISVESEVQDYGDRGTLIVNSWIAEKKGLISDE